MTARRLLAMLAVSLGALAAALPATAGGYAAIAPPPTPSSVTGLPDGRVYEQVSPPNKHGNEVAGVLNEEFSGGLAAPDGEAVMYSATGALSEMFPYSPGNALTVSEHTGDGWTTRSVLPAPASGQSSPEEFVGVASIPTWIDASADLSHVLFQTWGEDPYVNGTPSEVQREEGNNIYLAGPDPFVEPEWAGRSLLAAYPFGEGEAGKEIGIDGSVSFAGGSSDLSTVYFTYAGKLLPGADVSHLYEYSDGVLSDAGTLPGGEAGTSVATPMAQPATNYPIAVGAEPGIIAPGAFENQVSTDGSRLFFTRADGAGTTELYVHITGSDGSQSTTLVSASQLSGHVGEPASSGPRLMPSTEPDNGGLFGTVGNLPSYGFASPDGSHVFFQSVDRLTEAAPADGSVKTYDFDVEAGTLEYLPGVSGSIASASADGSSFVFENTSTTPAELERWAAGPGGGSVSAIVQLPPTGKSPCGSDVVCAGPFYTTADGSVVVFSTESPIAGFNDGGTHEGRYLGSSIGEEPNQEVFRYDAESEELSCVSCAPAGTTPSGDAVISNTQFNDNAYVATGGSIYVGTPGHGMSSNGDRVFFDSPEALVPQATSGVRHVYEWENGTVYLISPADSKTNSYFIDASESGDDVFFATVEGLVEGDTDGAGDVYDARVPRPDEQAPPAALPCQGDACQGPPSVPNLLGAPPSATFNGAGNLAPQTSSTTPAKPKQATKKATKKKATKKKKTKKKKTKKGKPKSKSIRAAKRSGSSLSTPATARERGKR